jgi:predicted PurR-regulated permease PerM
VDFGSLSSVDEEESFPSEFQKRTLWKAVTGLAILVLGALLVGLIWLTSNVLGYLQPVLVPLAVAGIVAYLLDPVVQKLQKRGFSRMKGIITVFSGFVIFFAILGAFIGVKLSSQLEDFGSQSTDFSNEERLVEEKQNSLYGWLVRDFFSKDAKAVKEHLENDKTINGPGGDILAKHQVTDDELASIIASSWSTTPKVDTTESDQENDSPDENEPEVKLENAQEVYIESSLSLNNFWLTKGGGMISSFLKSAQAWIYSSYGKILGVLGIIIGFAMVPIYLYYFLKESDSIKEGWEDYVPLRRSHFKTEVVDTLREINGYLISFFRGQVLVAFIDGILVGIALTIYGLNYGLLIGVVMAMLGIIPFIGNILCLIPACIIAYFQDEIPYGLPEWGYALGVVLIFIVVQQINSLVTAPKIVGDSVGLHPMTVIFSMLFWSLILGGFLGALLAVPLTAAVKVLFRRYVWDRQMQETQKPSASPA